MTSNEAEKNFLGPSKILDFGKKKNFFFEIFLPKSQIFDWTKKIFSPIGGRLHRQIDVFCLFGAQKRQFPEKIALEVVL